MQPIRSLFPAALLLGAGLAAPAAFAPAAFAEGPVGPEGGGHGDDMQRIQELSREISRALRVNEEELAKLARGEEGKPSRVDIELPPSPESKAPPSGGT